MFIRYLCALLTLLAASSFCHGATLQVAPVTLTLSGDQRAAALYLTNTGTAPIRAQIQIQQWSQINGKDHLSATSDLVSSPSMTELAAGQRQLIRIITQAPLAAGTEASYRLIIDELPGNAPREPGVRFLLQYSIPVFRVPDGLASENPETMIHCARLTTGDDIACSNPGQRHIKLSQLKTTRESHPGLVGYVLPGEQFTLPLKSPAGVGNLQLLLNDNTHASTIPVNGANSPASIGAAAHR